MSKYVDIKHYKWLFRKAYNNSKVILLSWYLYEDISRIVKRDDVVVCPNGTPSVLKGVPEFKRNNDVPHLLYLSNLVESKGVLVLLDAVKLLKERGYQFVCDIIGGETKEISVDCFAQEIAQRGIADIVAYHGKQYGDEKNKFWMQADIFVFPTFYYNECFPLVLLEAMEQGVPCVSTNEGGIADIIEEGVTGKIVEARNAVALADALCALLNDKELRENMGKAGYKKYQAEFTLDVFERRITRILKSTCV